jgi:hypothetical protein
MSHRTSLLVAALFPVLWGCSPRVEEELKLTLPLPPDCETLRIEIPTGGLTVEAGPAGQVGIDAITGRVAVDAAALERLAAIEFVPRLQPTGDTGVYLLDTPRVPDDMDPAENAMIFRGLLRVPPEVAVVVRTARGDLAARGFRAAVDLETSAGDLQLDRIEGPARGSTLHGNCIVTHHRGGLDLETGEGKILAYVDALTPEGIRLETTGTTIICHLPSDAGFDLDARVEQAEEGKISVRDAFGVPVLAEGRGHRATGAVGGGGPPVRLTVGRGWLSVVRLEPGN